MNKVGRIGIILASMVSLLIISNGGSSPAGALSPGTGIDCYAMVGYPQVHYGAYGLYGVVTVSDVVDCNAVGIAVEDKLSLLEDLVQQGWHGVFKLCVPSYIGCIVTNTASAVIRNGNPQAWFGIMYTGVKDILNPYLGNDTNLPNGYEGPALTLQGSTFTPVK